MDAKKTATAEKTKNFSNSIQSDYSTKKANFPEKPENLPCFVDEPEKIFKFQTTAQMTNYLVGIFAGEGVFIDRAGEILLQKFFRKVYAMWQSNKKITLEKMKNTFLDIFHKQKHCTQTQDAVFIAGDIACAVCTEVSLLDQNATQDWREF